MPIIGEGFIKANGLIGPFLDDEVREAAGTPAEVARVVTAKGWAAWTKATNETVVYVSEPGAIYRDRGNHGNGLLVQIATSFLA